MVGEEAVSTPSLPQWLRTSKYASAQVAEAHALGVTTWPLPTSGREVAEWPSVREEGRKQEGLRSLLLSSIPPLLLLPQPPSTWLEFVPGILPFTSPSPGASCDFALAAPKEATAREFVRDAKASWCWPDINASLARNLSNYRRSPLVTCQLWGKDTLAWSVSMQENTRACSCLKVSSHLYPQHLFSLSHSRP